MSKPKSSNFYPNFRDRSFSEGRRCHQQGIPLLNHQQPLTGINHGHQQQQQQHPPPYASLMNLPSHHHPPPQQQQPFYPHQNGNNIPIYPYPPPMIHQQPPPQQPIIMNQIAPAAAPAPMPQPTNIVINAQANGGAGGLGGGRNVAAHAMGGFECPFCHLGIVKRRRNPLIKIAVILIALLAFPLGLLSCILSWLPCSFKSTAIFTFSFCVLATILCCIPCAFQLKCTTCKKTV